MAHYRMMNVLVIRVSETMGSGINGHGASDKVRIVGNNKLAYRELARGKQNAGGGEPLARERQEKRTHFSKLTEYYLVIL